MNIKQRIRNYLEIKDPTDPKVIAKLEAELDFWKNTLRKYSRIPCAHCHKQMHVYPYGGAYYTHKGKKVHAECYFDYLEKNNE